MPVGSLGSGSGVDVDSLVKKLVSARKDEKVKLYNQKIEGYNAKLSALGTVNSAIDKFSESVKKINNEMLFTGHNALIDQPDNAKVLDVTAGGAASNENYQIGVEQLAKGSRAISKSDTFPSANVALAEYGGKLKFEAGKDSFTLDIKPKTTLTDLRNQINSAKDNFGVAANIVDDGKGHTFFTIGSDKEGKGNTLKITATDNPTPKTKVPISDSLSKTNAESFTEPALSKKILSLSSVATVGANAGMSIPADGQAQDAIITIDGIKVFKDSNTFDKTVPGLVIKALAVSKPTSVKITTDKKTVKDSISAFIDSYNNLQTVLDKNSVKGAVLNGNSMVRNLKTGMSSSLMTRYSGTGDLGSIFDLGIKLDRNGMLSLDERKLNKALDNNYSEVPKLFAGGNGLGQKMSTMLQSYTGIRGMGKTMVNSLQTSKNSTQQNLDTFEENMKKYENTLRDRFTRLNTQLSNMRSQGDYLNTILAK